MPSAIGGIVGGLFGSKTPKAPNVQTFQPGGTQDFDKLYQELATSVAKNNPYATVTPEALATFNTQYNNPYATPYQTAANAAGTAYGQEGQQAGANSTALSTAANAALPAATQALNMGFDPQNALYQRTLQQLNDQVNVGQAQRGITDSPYGASVANNANENFNIDWQNNQLTRALQALSGYTSAVSGAGTEMTTANNLGAAGAAATNNSGAVPFAAANSVTSNQNDAITQLLNVIGNSGGAGYDQQSLQDLLSYLQLGANQSNAQGQLTLQNYQNQLNASKASQSGLGGLVSNILTGGGTLANANYGNGIGGFISSVI
jgi:hypothetical protein